MNSYEKHRESAVQKESAEIKYETARGALIRANEEYAQAIQKYEDVLKNAKEEITPELLMEAYGEYKQSLKDEMSKAQQNDDYAEVIKIAEKLKSMDEMYLTDRRSSPVDEIADEALDMLERHGIPINKREHFFNRAARLAAKAGTSPIEAIHREIHSKPEQIAEPPFTGWESRTGGNA